MAISAPKKKVLDSFESRKDTWDHSDFERELELSTGSRYGNYQTAKLTILQADKAGQRPRTVERFVRSNFARFGNLPVELNPLGTRLGCSPRRPVATRRRLGSNELIYSIAPGPAGRNVYLSGAARH